IPRQYAKAAGQVLGAVNPMAESPTVMGSHLAGRGVELLKGVGNILSPLQDAGGKVLGDFSDWLRSHTGQLSDDQINKDLDFYRGHDSDTARTMVPYLESLLKLPEDQRAGVQHQAAETVGSFMGGAVSLGGVVKGGIKLMTGAKNALTVAEAARMVNEGEQGAATVGRAAAATGYQGAKTAGKAAMAGVENADLPPSPNVDRMAVSDSAKALIQGI